MSDTTRTVYFRADMNGQIASGHVMRCLSIADALKKIGIESVFISADDTPSEPVKGRGYEIRVLGTDWQDMENETEKLISCVLQEAQPLSGKADQTAVADQTAGTDQTAGADNTNEGKPVLFVDSYQATAGYFSMISRYFYTVYIDDLLDTAYPADMVLCYAVYADTGIFEKLYGKAGIKLPRLLPGTEYAPIRDMFADCSAHLIRDRIKNVFIMTGGTDKYNMLDALLERLSSVRKDINYTAVCGLLYPGREQLAQKYDGEENISIIAPVKNIRDYYEWADVVITAGGTSLYELCAAGTPAITFSFADNQFLNVKTFDKMGVMRYAGDARTDDVPGNVCRLLEEYCSKDIRSRMSEMEQNLVSGRGADKIAEVISGLLKD